MLESTPAKQIDIVNIERKEGELILQLRNGIQCLTLVSSRAIRVRYTDKKVFSNKNKPGIINQSVYEDWTYTEDEDTVLVCLKKLKLVINKHTNRFIYYDENGNLLLQERESDSKELDEFPIFRISEDGLKTEYIDTPDGRKEVVREAERIQTGTAYHTRLHLSPDEEEALYGLGQHEEGYHSLRGNKVYLHQANRKIAIPMLVSTKGYGLLFNTYSPAIFNDTIEGSYFYTEADPEMDFYFMNGTDMDGVVREYRNLTGQAAMLPKWAFGYIQSQERYETQEEILELAKEYRERGIGLDCIVLDWCSWEGDKWGQKTFDAERFPKPYQMTEQLHKEHVHFMISIWPNMAEDTDNYMEFREKKQLLPACAIYDALSKDARETYWKQVERGLYSHGVDAWWCDSSEPFTPEWNHIVKPESSGMYDEYCRNVSNHMPVDMMNSYGYFHALGIYEGQRKSDLENNRERRVVNLTRSGYIGQQRLGTIMWSGDIAATWDTLKRQIAAGLHFCASGIPYWTVDIGAFFVKNGMQWFWRGDYNEGVANPGYCELFTRWYQWGAFLPIFRGHGTDFRRELWLFDKEDTPFYEALLKANRTRYELMPYIYSLAGMCWKSGGLIMKPLAFGFTADSNTWNIMDQYLFGDNLMVCPVTGPMYYDKNGEKINDSRYTRKVYLPAGTDWYDFWTNRRYEGGRWINADAPLDIIPVYVKAGSILPCAKAALSVEEQSDEIRLKIYAGADGEFEIYTDSGDGYAYENGEYNIVKIVWKDECGTWSADGEISADTQYVIVR